MASAPRALSMLPAIKCSSCGVEIEISMMGEHVCSQGISSSRCLIPCPPNESQLLNRVRSSNC
jgi:hypothetical protein